MTALAVAMLLPERAPFWVAFTGVFSAPLLALWTFAMHRAARRAEVTIVTYQRILADWRS